MSRPVLIAAGAALVLVLGYLAVRLSASDETKIRWLLSDAAASFDRTGLSGCIEAFDPEYRDETVTGLDRPMLAAALRYLFLRRIDPKTKAFLFRVRLPEEQLDVAVGPDGAATATFVLELEQQSAEGWRPAWKLRVEAKLRLVDGEWRIHRSSHDTLAGKPPR